MKLLGGFAAALLRALGSGSDTPEKMQSLAPRYLPAPPSHYGIALAMRPGTTQRKRRRRWRQIGRRR